VVSKKTQQFLATCNCKKEGDDSPSQNYDKQISLSLILHTQIKDYLDVMKKE
jgi:hypothetical protein